MRWINSCECPFCGDENWACEHLVLDLGGGGEDGGVGLRAWGGLDTQAEMFQALLNVIRFAWGEAQSPSESSGVRARLQALAPRLPFGAEDWWCGRYNLVDLIIERIGLDDGNMDPGGKRERFLSNQLSDEGDAEEGSLLEWIWLHVMERVLEDVPEITIGDCLVMSMTAGLYYLVWAEDRAQAETHIASAVSSLAAQIRDAVAGAGELADHRD